VSTRESPRDRDAPGCRSESGSACRRRDLSLTFVCSYQLALVMPGMYPPSESCRKQIRQSLNLRRKPRARPQTLQRFFLRVMNFGFRSALTIIAVLAINPFSVRRSPLADPPVLGERRSANLLSRAERHPQFAK